MLQINQLKVATTSQQADLKPVIAKALRISQDEIADYKILKRSIDARKKPELYFIYSVAVALKISEDKILSKHKKSPDIIAYAPKIYRLPACGSTRLNHRPVIIGAGPAGLFAALCLSQAGFKPLVIERGASVEKRRATVDDFWQTGRLNLETNVQFGEGGAGAFSDGKLNTVVKDKTGRNTFVLQKFVEFGASEQILWDAKPHVGTDALINVIANLRNDIIRLGGEFLFETKVEDFIIEDGRLKGLVTSKGKILTAVAVLAIGHSARDTFKTLYDRGILMHAKEFAVGFRIEHPQRLIDESQYGSPMLGLPPSPYKLAKTLPNKRGVYSFCMCPGGYVVNASSAPNATVVNGMSYARRDSNNANSAIVVSVGAGEFNLNEPLAAVEYQKALEEKAYRLASGKIPQQLLGDYKTRRVSTSYGSFSSETKGEACFADLNGIFSTEIRESFLNAMEDFGKKIAGFDSYDAILSGVESRTSSPVRIVRDEQLNSSLAGLYPCGEGAGYAGGITSAAMDGMKVAEAIILAYSPYEFK